LLSCRSCRSCRYQDWRLTQLPGHMIHMQIMCNWPSNSWAAAAAASFLRAARSIKRWPLLSTGLHL
jgi:hypothetical protein